MKKFLLVAAFAVCGIFSANAQGFKVGANVGYPIGDAGDAYSLQVGLDVAYTWEVGDGFQVGATTGYLRYFGEDMEETLNGVTIEVESVDAGFIPIAATAQYTFGEMWFLGADIGYAVYVGEGDGNGGFLYQPKFGWSSESIDVYAFYKGISISDEETTQSYGDVEVTTSTGGGTASSVGLGVAFKF